jgi:hypothetical protein
MPKRVHRADILHVDIHIYLRRYRSSLRWVDFLHIHSIFRVDVDVGVFLSYFCFVYLQVVAKLNGMCLYVHLGLTRELREEPRIDTMYLGTEVLDTSRESIHVR